MPKKQSLGMYFDNMALYLSAELTKMHPFRLFFFLAILPRERQLKMVKLHGSWCVSLILKGLIFTFNIGYV